MIFVGKWSHGGNFFFHAFCATLLAPVGFVIFFFFYIKPIIHHKGLLYVCMAFWECKSTVCEYFMLSIFFRHPFLIQLIQYETKSHQLSDLNCCFSRGPCLFLIALFANICIYSLSQIIIAVDFWHLALISTSCPLSVTCVISAVIVQIEYCLQKQTSSCVAAAYLVDFFFCPCIQQVFLVLCKMAKHFYH